MEDLVLSEMFDVDSQLELEKTTSSLCVNLSDIHQFNFSGYDYPGVWGPWPPPLGVISAVKIASCAINMIISILGNCAVIVSVYHNPALRSTINLYLVNLAVADVLISLCCTWPHLVNDLTKPAFVLGAFMCKFNAFAQMTCLTSSVLTLTAIACDRFMAVLYPLRVRITQCRAGSVIISIWAISIAVALPFAVYRQLLHIQWKNAVEITCQETWPVYFTFDPQTGSCTSTVWPKTLYYTLVSITLFFLPILIMSVAYALIVWRLWGNKPPGEKMDVALNNQAIAKRKVVKMVVVILFVFVVCWMPLQVLILYAQFTHNQQENGELPKWYDHLMFLVYFIAYTNSTVNPLLYGGLNQTYRKTLIRVLCRKWRSPSRPDSGGSLQGSIPLVEFRASPHAMHTRATSVRSMTVRGQGHHPMSTTLVTSSLRSNYAQRNNHVQHELPKSKKQRKRELLG